MRLQKLPLFSPGLNESIFGNGQRKARNNDLEVKDANEHWHSLLVVMLRGIVTRWWDQGHKVAHVAFGSKAVYGVQGSSSPAPCSRSLSRV